MTSTNSTNQSEIIQSLISNKRYICATFAYLDTYFDTDTTPLVCDLSNSKKAAETIKAYKERLLKMQVGLETAIILTVAHLLKIGDLDLDMLRLFASPNLYTHMNLPLPHVLLSGIKGMWGLMPVLEGDEHPKDDNLSPQLEILFKNIILHSHDYVEHDIGEVFISSRTAQFAFVIERGTNWKFKIVRKMRSILRDLKLNPLESPKIPVAVAEAFAVYEQFMRMGKITDELISLHSVAQEA